jgi:hypothetical protein
MGSSEQFISSGQVVRDIFAGRYDEDKDMINDHRIM